MISAPTSDLQPQCRSGHSWLLNPLAALAVLCSAGTPTSHCSFFFCFSVASTVLLLMLILFLQLP